MYTASLLTQNVGKELAWLVLAGERLQLVTI